ncbi:type VI secretion system baseplate subunit TssK [Rubinisphaera brasiliensis]|uniref:Type VI secretion protein, VC_A0114 family n=1 Tax=Rubinisphaera brasiliensis (strain ATCC 49424 / DSM 5305 / JCM 21570 / IAM 15109 / NBRC 103401 / IFAM 1448) TaxID=756272 RepID=F0SFF7_RUBBR|nr:type VI secretion system baseplate subunit TssK [Rubinisphaera brasiliensis]ADY59364.1 type VI secretion protein, VC_A0114 family [Rubinisphaera brasiliensis DSM 5305]
MKYAGIHWHEGQFLHPHHFQAADRYWTELSALQQHWDHPYGYGLQDVEINTEALANSHFEVNRIHARFQDGTVVSLGEGQVPNRIHLKPLESNSEEETGPLTVYLGVPRLKLGRQNVAGTEGGLHRFVESEIAVQDETQGGSDQDVRIKHLNVRMLLSTEDTAGFDLVPICQLATSASESSGLQIYKDYIPPVLNIDAWSELGRGIVRSCMDMVGRKCEILSSQLHARRVGFESRHPGDLDRLIMLSNLNAIYATLNGLSYMRGVHPQIAFLELYRAIGNLAIFAPSRRIPELPKYDHENLGPVFRILREELEKLLNSVQEYEFEQRPFLGMGLGMQATLEPKWFHSTWEWFIGVNKGELSGEECRDLLSPGHLDWKFGSARQVEALFQRRSEGLTLEPLDRAIRALPSDSDWLFYRIPRTASPAWQDVQATQTLAMRLRDSLILNQADLQGERRIIVSYRGKNIPLEFSLFAVPQQT